MMHRLVMAVAAMFLIACVASSCNGGGGVTPVPPQGETRIILASGGGAIFPAGAFTESTEVDVNEDLTGAQSNNAGYPDNSGALLGTTTVKVPAGVVLNADIEVLIALSPAQPTNLAFTIFMFNDTTGMWETTAAASSASKALAAMGMISNGNVLSFMADSAGTTGFEGTYGVFENYSQEIGDGPPDGPNEIPTVSLDADATTVDPDVTVNLTATGSDPDDDPLTFSWMAAGGTLGTADTTDGNSTNTWSASDGGMYTVSVAVNDGNGGVATDSVMIEVTGVPPPPENEPPVFDPEEITGDVAAPVVGQRVWLTATAHDPEHGDVSFDWSGPGSFADETVDEHGARVFWTPDAEGSATVTCTVSDPEGNEATLDFTTDVAAYPSAFDFVGYPTCVGCHSDKGDEGAGTGWFGTHHAIAFTRSLGPENAHGYRNPSCYNCHALGWNPNDSGQGFIDMDLTPELGNIQCEHCHGGGDPPGMGAGHKSLVWDPLVGMMYDETEMTWVPDDDFDSTNGVGCGACHEGGRHGAVEEWAESAHYLRPNAGDTEEDDENPGTEIPHHAITGDSCAKCHNGQEYVRVKIDGEEPADVELTLDDLPDVKISCTTCHDPHSDEYASQLRVDSDGEVAIPFSDTDDVPTMVMAGKGNICVDCHNGRRDRGEYESRVWSGSGHFGPHGNAQGAMLFGVMGGDLGNPPEPTTYEDEHPHRTWNENTCVTCHMYRRDYIDSENPTIWGHSFEPRFERCITCHSNWGEEDEEAFWEWVEEYEAEVEALMQAFRDAWPPEWLDGDGEPENRDTDPPSGVGPPRDDPVGAAYRAALWNYMLVEEDQTHGIHNPTFTRSLIEEAIASVDALPDP